MQEAGLSLAEAKRCEQIARVPEREFEAYLAARAADKKAVTADDAADFRPRVFMYDFPRVTD